MVFLCILYKGKFFLYAYYIKENLFPELIRLITSKIWAREGTTDYFKNLGGEGYWGLRFLLFRFFMLAVLFSVSIFHNY